MKFMLEIDIDGDAFLPIAGDEIARILRLVAGRIEEGCEGTSLQSPHSERDYNGNRCCSFSVTDDDA